MKPTIIINRSFLIIVLIVLLCSLCYWGYDELIALDVDDILSAYTTYKYNPKTIIKEIHEGKPNLFTETETKIGTNFIYENKEITMFTDQELFEISQYIINNYCQNDDDQWGLIETKYRYFDCPSTHDDDAILSAILFEKNITQNDENTNNLCSIGIATYSNTVTLRMSEEKREWPIEILSLDDKKFFSADIVDIVKETNIYKEKQEEANHCGYFSITLDSYDNYWRVNYYAGNDSDLLFSLEVDSITGNVSDGAIENQPTE